MKKPHPERVDPPAGAEAVRAADGDRMGAWTQYVIVHFRRTGQLAPGCDARDFFAWYDGHKKGESIG